MGHLEATALFFAIFVAVGAVVFFIVRWLLLQIRSDAIKSSNVSLRDLITAALIVSIGLVLFWFIEKGSSVASVIFSSVFLGAQVVCLIVISRVNKDRSNDA